MKCFHLKLWSKAKRVCWIAFVAPLVLLLVAIPNLYAANNDGPLDDNDLPTYGWLGIQMGDLPEDTSRESQMNSKSGVLVIKVEQDSPAEIAGLQAGDTILKFNKEPVSGSMDLNNRLRAMRPGAVASLLVQRSQEVFTLIVTLGEMPPKMVALRLAYSAQSEGDEAHSARNFKKALDQYKKAFELVQRYSGDAWEIGTAHIKLANAYQSMKDNSAAVAQYAQAAESFERADSPLFAIGAKKVIGAIQFDSGQYSEAVSSLKGILESLDALDQTKELITEDRKFFFFRERASTLFTLAAAYHKLGEVFAQIRTCRQLIGEFVGPTVTTKARKEITLSGTERNYIGFCFSVIGEEELALRQFDLAIQILEVPNNSEVDAVLQEASAWRLKGDSYVNLARYEEAIEHYRMATLKFHDTDDRNSEAEALFSLGDIHGRLAQYERATAYLQAALDIFEHEGNLIRQGDTLLKLSEMSGGVKAEKYFEQARMIFLKDILLEFPDFFSAPWDWSQTATELGSGKHFGSIGNEMPERYRKMGEAVLRILSQKTPEELITLSRVQTTRASRILFTEMKTLEAQAAKGWCQLMIRTLKWNLDTFRDLPKSREQRIEEYNSHFLLGVAYFKSGRLKSALQHFQLAQNMNDINRGLSAASLDYYIASTYADMSDTNNALTFFRRGLVKLKSLESQSPFINSESKIQTFDRIAAQFKSFVPFLIDLNLQKNESQYLYEAFYTTQRLKSRIFLEELRKATASYYLPKGGALTKNAKHVRKQIVRLSRILQDPKVSEIAESQLLRELAKLRKRWATVEEEAQVEWPQYAELVTPSSAKVEEIQGSLDDRTVVLEYAVSPIGLTTLFAITKSNFKVVQLPKSIRQLANDYLSTLKKPILETQSMAHHVSLGQKLYRHLLKPVEDLLACKRHLLIAPDGLLHYLPFEALILPDGVLNKGKQTNRIDVPYLMKAYNVTYFPSSSVMMTSLVHHATNYDSSALPLLVFGDPIYERFGKLTGANEQNIDLAELTFRNWSLERLKYSGEEARNIAAIWNVPQTAPHINIRELANVKRLKELDLARYRILHFAAHAIVDDHISWGREPALVLSQHSPDRRSGLLKFSDIMDLELNADLVVLSACNTRLGKLHEGEGIVGMTRAFMYAGAKSVVVSLWNVEDQSTSLLMQRFHQRLKNGESKGEALRQAKLDMMQETIELDSIGMKQSLASPFFWAPFVLVGNWE